MGKLNQGRTYTETDRKLQEYTKASNNKIKQETARQEANITSTGIVLKTYHVFMLTGEVLGSFCWAS